MGAPPPKNEVKKKCDGIQKKVRGLQSVTFAPTYPKFSHLALTEKKWEPKYIRQPLKGSCHLKLTFDMLKDYPQTSQKTYYKISKSSYSPHIFNLYAIFSYQLGTKNGHQEQNQGTKKCHSELKSGTKVCHRNKPREQKVVTRNKPWNFMQQIQVNSFCSRGLFW